MSLVPADSAEAAKLVAGATAWQVSASANNTLLDKWHNLFHAYDIQESGTISCGDFVKLEIRNGFEQGDLKRILRAFPTLKADSISKGRLDFMDFCKARLDSFEGVAWFWLVMSFFFKFHVTMYRLSLSSIKSMLLPRPLGLCRVSNSCYKWQIAT